MYGIASHWPYWACKVIVKDFSIIINVTPSPWLRSGSSHEDLSMQTNTHVHTDVFLLTFRPEFRIKCLVIWLGFGDVLSRGIRHLLPFGQISRQVARIAVIQLDVHVTMEAIPPRRQYLHSVTDRSFPSNKQSYMFLVAMHGQILLVYPNWRRRRDRFSETRAV
jgi:hypothetical protein